MTERAANATTLLARGLELFDRGEWYEAHEVWERLWKGRRGSPEGAPLQGLIQLAAAFWQIERGRHRPAERLLVAALAKLGEREEIDGVSLAPFRRRAERALELVRAGRLEEVLGGPAGAEGAKPTGSRAE